MPIDNLINKINHAELKASKTVIFSLDEAKQLRDFLLKKFAEEPLRKQPEQKPSIKNMTIKGGSF